MHNDLECVCDYNMPIWLEKQTTDALTDLAFSPISPTVTIRMNRRCCAWRRRWDSTSKNVNKRCAMTTRFWRLKKALVIGQWRESQVRSCRSLQHITSMKFTQRAHAEAWTEICWVGISYSVTGVPMFMMNGYATFSGAQDPDTFMKVFDQIAAKLAK